MCIREHVCACVRVHRSVARSSASDKHCRGRLFPFPLEVFWHVRGGATHVNHFNLDLLKHVRAEMLRKFAEGLENGVPRRALRRTWGGRCACTSSASAALGKGVREPYRRCMEEVARRTVHSCVLVSAWRIGDSARIRRPLTRENPTEKEINCVYNFMWVCVAVCACAVWFESHQRTAQ